MMEATFLFHGLYPQMEHVHHDERVYNDDGKSNPGRTVNQVGDFERNVDGSRDQSQPLGPRQGVPETVGLDESQDSINAGHDGDFPESYVADAIDEVNEHADVVVVGIDVKELEKTLRDAPDIFVAHGKNTEAGKHHDHAFGKFNRGDSSHALDMFVIAEDWVHVGCVSIPPREKHACQGPPAGRERQLWRRTLSRNSATISFAALRAASS